MNQSTNIKLTAEISATSKGLVDALNQASSAVNSTSESWKSRFDKLKDSTSVMSQAVRNLGDTVSRIDSQGDLSHLSSSLGEVQSVFSRVQSEVVAFSHQMASLKNSASELGMPVEEYQQFAEAVRQAGMSMEDGERMIKAMQERIQDFVNGVPEAVAQFDKFGISVERVSSNRATSNFREIAQAINETIPPTERATQCMDLFRASVDRTNAVSDQFNKVISSQDKDFVSEKDVQSAIGLEGAIERLGEQLGKYVTETKKAEKDINDYIRRTAELMDLEKQDERLKANLVKATDDYNKSLESVKSKIATVGDAYKNLAKDIQGAKDAIAQNDDEQNEMLLMSGDLDTTISLVDKLYDSLLSEVAVVQDIMALRNNAGAPVDTKEMDDAIERVHKLISSMDELSDVFASLGDTGNVEFLADYREMVEKLEVALEDLKTDAEQMNFDLGIKEATEQLTALMTKFNEAKANLANGTRVEFDTRELDEFLNKLESIKPLDFEGERQLEVANRWANELKNSIAEYNAEIQNGYPLWQPIQNAVRNIINGYLEAEDAMIRFGNAADRAPMKALADLGRKLWQNVKRAWTYMTHFKNTAGQASGQLRNAGAFLGKSLMQIMGMGSAVAVVAKAWQNVNALLKEYINNLHEAEKAELYGNAGAGADDMKRVREKRDTELDNLMKDLKAFADLYDAEKAGGGEEARAKRINAQDDLWYKYGFEFNETNGAIEDLDKQISQQLEKLLDKRLNAIDAQIRANNKVREGVDKYVKSFDGFLGYWKQVGYTFTGDVNGANAIREAQERSTRASDENIALEGKYNELNRNDLSEQWQRIRQGKVKDDASKKQEEAEKKYEEALNKLKEWSESINDTEHQKQLREIWKKYSDAVDAGVNPLNARNVAIQAIAQVLKKEKEDEQKKHDELVKAMDERTKQYQESFKAYADAQRAVVDAQKDYARTQKDLANEAKEERIQKRRERLQRAMSRFGFQTYEGFNLNEKPSETRERRRNAQLDASISEKMAKSQSGQRVHFTHAEKERISQFQTLQKKDKQLEASQKAMEAADKQLKAAEQLQDAAKSVKDAVEGRGDALKELGSTIGDMLNNSLPKLNKNRNINKEAREEFDSKERKRLGRDPFWEPKPWNENPFSFAKGVNPHTLEQSVDYSQQFSQIHTDLQNLNKRVFVVK